MSLPLPVSICLYDCIFVHRDSRKYLFKDTDLVECLIETLIERAQPPTSAPTDGSRVKAPYCYGAKPFQPIAGHLIQLAKSIEQSLSAPMMNDVRPSGSSGLDASTDSASLITNSDNMSDLANKLEMLEMRMNSEETVAAVGTEVAVSDTTGKEPDLDSATIAASDSAKLSHEQVDLNVSAVSSSGNMVDNSLKEILESIPVVDKEGIVNMYQHWKWFVDKYPQYFCEEEAPVIVFPSGPGADVVSLLCYSLDNCIVSIIAEPVLCVYYC